MPAKVPYRGECIEGHQQTCNQFESSTQKKGDEGHGGYFRGMREIAIVKYFPHECTHKGTQNDSPRHEEHTCYDT